MKNNIMMQLHVKYAFQDNYIFFVFRFVQIKLSVYSLFATGNKSFFKETFVIHLWPGCLVGCKSNWEKKTTEISPQNKNNEKITK